MATISSVGFLGAGQMASALAGGLRANLWKDLPFFVTDRFEESSLRFSGRFGAQTCADTQYLASKSDLLFLCVKPQDVASALTEELRTALDGKILVSVVAGLTLETLARHAGSDCRICRSMPNTAAEISKAVTVVCFSENTGAEERVEIKAAFATVGACLELDEKHFDAVVALSGSGPAYACLLVEAMTVGGIAEGLPPDVARELAAHAVLGAAALVLETGRSPEELRKKISSPGGTTLAALEKMEKGLVRQHIHDAVKAAAARSRELSKW